MPAVSRSQLERKGKRCAEKGRRSNQGAQQLPDFLRDSTNKEELFQFLSDKVGSNDWPDGKEVFITSGTDVISRGSDHSMPRLNCKEFQLLERFTVIIYNKKSNLDSVNEARRNSSPRKQDNGEHSPNARSPSAAHTARSLPAGIWATSDHCEQKPPTSEGFGWTLESATKTWRPVCSNLPVASQACSGLIKWLQKRHVHVWRTMLMQEGAVEVHITLQLPM
ncbi:hypothetical protein GWK47_034403 [Chionoecetes opilio]|uniref:Uncharacterized protein n=1 Tax=Chionoecetes opilio TaxID=41210 RepID=A0A8J4YIC3_CHIOP|nr:hypothetical protein GWK47_034403 [Chionoecetes opilio]